MVISVYISAPFEAGRQFDSLSARSGCTSRYHDLVMPELLRRFESFSNRIRCLHKSKRRWQQCPTHPYLCSNGCISQPWPRKAIRRSLKTSTFPEGVHFRVASWPNDRLLACANKVSFKGNYENKTSTSSWNYPELDLSTNIYIHRRKFQSRPVKIIPTGSTVPV